MKGIMEDGNRKKTKENEYKIRVKQNEGEREKKGEERKT